MGQICQAARGAGEGSAWELPDPPGGSPRSRGGARYTRLLGIPKGNKPERL
jgi:hypothetical protein